MNTALLAAGKFLASAVMDYVRHRQNVKAEQRKGELEIQKAEVKSRIARTLDADAHAAALDRQSVVQRGWKDDYLLILTTLPVALLFVAPLVELWQAEVYRPGDLQAAVKMGFSGLQQTPEYYWWALGLVYIDTFGFRRLLRAAIETRLGGAHAPKGQRDGGL